MKTSAGEVEIAVPRDRNGEFEPRLIKKNETTLSGDIEEKIISMYAKGMTTLNIYTHAVQKSNAKALNLMANLLEQTES